METDTCTCMSQHVPRCVRKTNRKRAISGRGSKNSILTVTIRKRRFGTNRHQDRHQEIRPLSVQTFGPNPVSAVVNGGAQALRNRAGPINRRQCLLCAVPVTPARGGCQHPVHAPLSPAPSPERAYCWLDVGPWRHVDRPVLSTMR